MHLDLRLRALSYSKPLCIFSAHAWRIAFGIKVTYRMIQFLFALWGHGSWLWIVMWIELSTFRDRIIFNIQFILFFSIICRAYFLSLGNSNSLLYLEYYRLFVSNKYYHTQYVWKLSIYHWIIFITYLTCMDITSMS